ncbi:MAG: hypothetical protein NVS1B4_09950 [Gemmatimonadaceae bacterium]
MSADASNDRLRPRDPPPENTLVPTPLRGASGEASGSFQRFAEVRRKLGLGGALVDAAAAMLFRRPQHVAGIARRFVLGSLPLPQRRFEVRFLYGHRLEDRHANRFRRTLRTLADDFEFVSMTEAATLARDPSPPAGRYLALSFDDGFRDNYDLVAPLLDEAGARGCFFIPTNFIESGEAYRRWILSERLHNRAHLEPMTWAMVAGLANAGFEIGTHTEDHVDLSVLSTDEAIRQVLASKSTVESRIGKECSLFAWPYGEWRRLPGAVLEGIRPHFAAIFAAMSGSAVVRRDGAVIDRDWFETWMHPAEVRAVLRGPRERQSAGPELPAARVAAPASSVRRTA